MRRDVYLENDSGGLSVLAASAVDAIIDDGRADDAKFVVGHQALLLELYGDDSMPVRIVVDEPLDEAERAQWLAHASWRIDSPDGRFLVMGGFDPDVLSWWKESHAPDQDGRGVAAFSAPPGQWRVDVYAHVGSMNGRKILEEMDEKPGAFFRRCHPGKPFPVWLACMLEGSGENDPDHSELWSDVSNRVSSGELVLDTSHSSVIGFLVHLTPFRGDLDEPPAGGWFALDHGMRLPTVFPLGLPSDLKNPELEWFLDRALLRASKDDDALPPATEIRANLDDWTGDPLAPFPAGETVDLLATNAHFLFGMAALCCDSPPHFEFEVRAKGGWTAPSATPECAVVARGNDVWRIGSPPNSGGWPLWHGAHFAAQALAGLPDGAEIEFATVAQDPNGDPSIGRSRFRGTVEAGVWKISARSPAIEASIVVRAIAFMADLMDRECIKIEDDTERSSFDEAVENYVFESESVVIEDEVARLEDPDPRTLRILAASVFRVRFHDQLATDPLDES